LADFQSHYEEFRAQGVAVVAASVDSFQDALTTVSRHQLAFPVAYGLDAASVAAGTGAFWDRTKRSLHATGFMLRPNGEVAGAVYSTGPLGRYSAKDALAWISFASKQSR
jgi:peroxiredoxin